MAIHSTKQMAKEHRESCLFHVGVVPEDSDLWSGIKEALDVFL